MKSVTINRKILKDKRMDAWDPYAIGSNNDGILDPSVKYVPRNTSHSWNFIFKNMRMIV